MKEHKKKIRVRLISYFRDYKKYSMETIILFSIHLSFLMLCLFSLVITSILEVYPEAIMLWVLGIGFTAFSMELCLHERTFFFVKMVAPPIYSFLFVPLGLYFSKSILTPSILYSFLAVLMVNAITHGVFRWLYSITIILSVFLYAINEMKQNHLAAEGVISYNVYILWIFFFALIALLITLFMNLIVNYLNSVTRNLAESEENYRTILREFPDFILKIDTSGKVVEYHGSISKMTFLNDNNLINLNIKDLIPSKFHEDLEEKIGIFDLERTETGFEFFIENNDVKSYYYLKLSHYMSNQYLCIISDISTNKETMLKMEILSLTDSLTGLYNRRYLEMEYERIVCDRNLPIALLILDLNGLKLVNDAFGHVQGDYLLKETANALLRVFRCDEIIARIGGDEFVVLIPMVSGDALEAIVDRIHLAVNQVIIHGMNAAISVGSCMISNANTSLDEAVTRADEVMYHSKNLNRASFQFSSVNALLGQLIKHNDIESKHFDEVYKLAMKIGTFLNLAESELDNLSIAAKYHDIGKCALSEELKLSTKIYDDDQRIAVRRHSEIGYHIGKFAFSNKEIAYGILHHHENWDGSGYPKGLIGEHIPLISRIIHVADAFEAMTNFRPYKKAKTIREAIEEINKLSGIQFDPYIVTVFMKNIDHQI